MTTVTATPNQVRSGSTGTHAVADHLSFEGGSRDDRRRLTALLEAIELRHSSGDISSTLQQLADLVTKGLGVTSVTLYLCG